MTPNCHLEPLAKRDFDALVELFTCPRARQYLGGPITDELASQRSMDWIARSSEDHIWAIRASTDPALLGYILLGKHHDGRYTEISYALLPDYWGRGLATDALSQASHLAFTELRLSRIIAETQAKNLRSTTLLKRIGMSEQRRVFRFGEEQIIFYLDSTTNQNAEQVTAPNRLTSSESNFHRD